VKILLITYSYTPDLTPRAFRWAALADELAQAGHEVHVLCAAELGPSPEVTVEGVQVHRVRDWLINASTRVTAGAASPGASRPGGWRAASRSFLRKTARTIWRATHWPDYACGWILPSAKKARELCRSNQYNWIVSVSHPFSGHMVGWLIQKDAPGARWLVDIGDPFCLMEEPSPNNRRLYAWLNRWMEARVLDRADAISVTTESTRQLYEAHFSRTLGKVHLMPPLLSLPPVPAAIERTGQGVAVRLVFVGTLYRRLRSPRYLLACFAALISRMPGRAIELHFYGATNDCAEELNACPEPARSSVFVHGIVGRSEVHSAMMEADILVNIGNDSASQLASKVIEYMSMGKPILNIISAESDTSMAAMVDYPAALTLLRGETPPSTDLDALCSFIERPPSVSPTTVEAVRARYSAAHIAALYRSILEQAGNP